VMVIYFLKYLIPIYIVLQVFKECHTFDGSGNSFELSLIGCKCISAYVKNKKNQNQAIKLDPFGFVSFEA